MKEEFSYEEEIIIELKAENAKLKEEIEKVTRENLFATANCGRYIREKHELKARVAELEEELHEFHEGYGSYGSMRKV